MTKKIIRIAVKGGRDLDGDLVVYRGHLYWVHVLENIVREVPKNMLRGDSNEQFKRVYEE